MCGKSGMAANDPKAEEGLDAPARRGEDNPVGFDGHGNAPIFTEEAADGLIPLIEKARKSGSRRGRAAAHPQEPAPVGST